MRLREGKNLSCARTKKLFENILKNKNLVNFHNPNFFAIFWPASFSNMNIPSITGGMRLHGNRTPGRFPLFGGCGRTPPTHTPQTVGGG